MLQLKMAAHANCFVAISLTNAETVRVYVSTVTTYAPYFFRGNTSHT